METWWGGGRITCRGQELKAKTNEEKGKERETSSSIKSKMENLRERWRENCWKLYKSTR